MKVFFSLLSAILLFGFTNDAFSQKLKFNQVLKDTTQDSKFYPIDKIAQDKQGYIWLATQKGLQRYDGTDVITFQNDPLDTNSLAGNFIQSLAIDKNNIFWLGILGLGLDRFDPSTNNFIHFRHNPKDAASLASDTVRDIIIDHLGNVCAATSAGLDLLDKSTGKFTHFMHNSTDNSSLGNKTADILFEDHHGILWVGTCPQNSDLMTYQGTLNKFDRSTGKFVHYVHDSSNVNSIAEGQITSMFEDGIGNFWIGFNKDNNLDIMNRDKGTFTHYHYDTTHSKNQLAMPFCYGCFGNVSFIQEDAGANIWIGSLIDGIIRYDPLSKKTTHYGWETKDSVSPSKLDTTAGNFDGNWVTSAFTSQDNLLWIGAHKDLFNINPLKTTIPYYSFAGSSANALYYEEGKNNLWVGTNAGLMIKNLNGQSIKIWKHDPHNVNSISNDTVGVMQLDHEGKLWIATNNGLDKYDPQQNIFTAYYRKGKDSLSLSSSNIYNVYVDHANNIWVSTGRGVNKMNSKTGECKQYHHNDKDHGSLDINFVYCVTETKDNNIWVGTFFGLNRLINATDKFQHYLPYIPVKNLFTDHLGVLWVCSPDGLYYYDKPKDKFLIYVDPNLKASIKNVLSVTEDDQKNLWVSTITSFIKINEARDQIKIYDAENGVHKNEFFLAYNYKAKNGELFFGDQSGYYAFTPSELKDNIVVPIINFTSLKINDAEVKVSKSGVLNEPFWKINEIDLNHSQNNFSIDFYAINYITPGGEKYLFKLENYDNTWHFIGSEHKAYFYNVPPGSYIFHAKAVNADGVWAEKTIRIIISPPWWKTWWAYILFSVLFIAILWSFIYYRSYSLKKENKLLEEKVSNRTSQLNQSLQELKSTQAQLIQSEKMASLGEVTAGIAHEIQNPLNFVNNFSEVNKELLVEMREEMEKGNIDDAKAIADDVIFNEEKINHHGKRAGDIVKGMLQHSRSSTGVKESTDINALADEYLRLSYHGLRAKDKSFNAEMKTDFDESIGQINIIPQDIGRVLLNLYNNAFYAVSERQKAAGKEYEPTVSVTTKKLESHVIITVSDNGNGIPQNIVNKIFQPFFTTKPTGQGTGLGLSLSYDIVKAHGGEIKVESKGREARPDEPFGLGTEFIIQLPSDVVGLNNPLA